MAFNIQTFKSSFADGGAGPTLYEVQVTFPRVEDAAEVLGASRTDAATKMMFTCTAASLPDSFIGVVPVYYFGRSIKVEGNREYRDWRATVLCDESFEVRTAFEAWHAKINSIVPNVMAQDFSSGAYKVSAYIRQYAKAGAGGGLNEGDIIREYEMVGMFPTDIGVINLSWDSTNRIETFDVTFAYDWWIPRQTSVSSISLGTGGAGAIPLVG